MSCTICSNRGSHNLQAVIPCGHTYCEPCLDNLFHRVGNAATCPSCSRPLTGRMTIHVNPEEGKSSDARIQRVAAVHLRPLSNDRTYAAFANAGPIPRRTQLFLISDKLVEMSTETAEEALRADGRDEAALLRHTTKQTSDPASERVLMISFLKRGVITHVPIIYRVPGASCNIGKVNNNGIVERDFTYPADMWSRPFGPGVDASSSDIAEFLCREGRIGAILSDISGKKN